MKKLSFVAAAALMATSAFAGDHTINLDGRLSWINTNNDTTKTHKANDSKFAAQDANLTFAGKLSPNTTYTVGLDLASVGLSTGAVNNGDNTGKFIDSIYVTKTLMQGLTLDIGKRGLLGGGFEVTHAAIDQYATSYYYSLVQAVQNQFGATATKDIMGHKIMAQLTNGNKTRLVGDTNANGTCDAGETACVASQSRYGYAFEWLGTWSPMLKTNIGYTVVPGNAQGASTDLFAAGLQLDIAKFVIDADYAQVKGKKALHAGAVDSKVDSITATVGYTGVENLTPFAKFVIDNYKDLDIANHYGEKRDAVTSFGLGVEYKESAKDAIRYHAVYTASKHKYETIGGSMYSDTTTAGAVDHTIATMFVGATINVNVL